MIEQKCQEENTTSVGAIVVFAPDSGVTYCKIGVVARDIGVTKDKLVATIVEQNTLFRDKLESNAIGTSGLKHLEPASGWAIVRFYCYLESAHIEEGEDVQFNLVSKEWEIKPTILDGIPFAPTKMVAKGHLYIDDGEVELLKLHLGNTIKLNLLRHPEMKRWVYRVLDDVRVSIDDLFIVSKDIDNIKMALSLQEKETGVYYMGKEDLLYILKSYYYLFEHTRQNVIIKGSGKATSVLNLSTNLSEYIKTEVKCHVELKSGHSLESIKARYYKAKIFSKVSELKPEDYNGFSTGVISGYKVNIVGLVLMIMSHGRKNAICMTGEFPELKIGKICSEVVKAHTGSMEADRLYKVVASCFGEVFPS